MRERRLVDEFVQQGDILRFCEHRLGRLDDDDEASLL